MATLSQLERALINADAAGDTEAARQFAAEIRRIRAVPSQPEKPMDARDEMGFMENAAAGAGKAVVDTGRGLRQLASNIPGLNRFDTFNPEKVQAEIDEAKQLDSKLMSTGGGMAGNVAGQVAMTLLPAGAAAKAGAVPGLARLGTAVMNPATIGQAAAVGAGMGFIQPVASDESRLMNTGMSAAGGAIGQKAGQLLGAGVNKLRNPVTNRLSETSRALADKADEIGIPLTAGQRTGNKAMQTVEAVLEQIPVTSGKQTAIKQGQRQALTRAALKETGEVADEISPEVMQSIYKRIGGDFERIFGKVKVEVGEELQQNLSNVMKEANDTLTPDKAKLVLNRISDIIGKVGEDGKIEGKAYQAWRSAVQKQAQGSGDEWFAGQLRNLYRAVDDAAYKAAADVGEDAALSTARGQYKAMKTLEPLAAKAVDGVISPNLLRGEVMKRTPDFARGGGGRLGEIARIGREFVGGQVPNSGTAQRAMMQSLLTGGIGGGIGYAGSGGDMTTAAQFAAGGLALPYIAQRAINSQAGQRYLGKGMGELTPEMMRRLELAGVLTGTGLVNLQQ